MRGPILSCLLMVPAFAQAQGGCEGRSITPDSCLAGWWVGETDAPAKIDAMLERLAGSGVDRSVMPSVPPVLGMVISEDGFYSTLPLHQSVSFTDTTPEDTTFVDMQLNIGTQVGMIWGNGGAMEFCDLGSMPPVLTGQIESGLGGGGSFAVTEMGGGGFTPSISYSCTATNLNWTVHLPAPVGEINYYLVRLPEDRFSEEFRDAYEARRLLRD